MKKKSKWTTPVDPKAKVQGPRRSEKGHLNK
jgi:hypothetical protein